MARRQGSDPLRLESLANQWDEEGAVPMLAGHLPSLHMHPNLTVCLATSRNFARCESYCWVPRAIVPNIRMSSMLC